MLQREPGSFPKSIGAFADGTILGMDPVIHSSAVSASGLQFLTMHVVLRRYTSSGALLDSLGVFLGSESIRETIESDDDRGIARGISAIAPFGRRGRWIAFGEHLYYGSSESYEIQVFGRKGGLKRIIRRPIQNPPVTARDKELFRDYWIEDSDRWAHRNVDKLEYPETKPAYGALSVDAVGNVWVAEYTMRSDDSGGNWTVFDPEGRMLGVVEVPRGGRVWEIGDDYLIGVWRTDLDVEQVLVYRLNKN